MTAALTAGSWVDLEAETPAYGRLAARVIADSDIVLAVDHERLRHVLLPIADDEEELSDAQSRGVVVRARVLAVEQRPPRRFLDVCCRDRAANDAFNLVADSLLHEMGRRASVVEAVRAAMARWRRFWANVPREGLLPEEVRGLFGELWLLLVWLLPHGPAAVDRWLGPAGARHDFQWRHMAIEVKTTSSSRGHVHRINGIDQLEPPDGGELMLFSLRLRQEPSASNSLPSLVERIALGLTGEPERLDVFEARLSSAGYSAIHDEVYREIRFRVIDERMYRVGDGFPRISDTSFRDGVPAGVERIEYDVSLDGLDHLVVARSAGEFRPPVR